MKSIKNVVFRYAPEPQKQMMFLNIHEMIYNDNG